MGDYTEHLISLAGGDGNYKHFAGDDCDGDTHAQGRALVAAIHERKRKAAMPDLDQIQARVDAATEGPWRVRECPPCTERGRLEVNIWDQPGNLMVTGWCDDDEFHRPDAEFIAHARTDVPALLAVVRSQQATIERAEEVAEKFDHTPGHRHAAHLLRAALTATEGAA